MNTFVKHISFRCIVLAGLLSVAWTSGHSQTTAASGAKPAVTACQISGTDTVNAGATASFTGHPCALKNWATSCGTLLNSSDSGATIRFDSSCSKAVISAGSASKTVIIRLAPAMLAAVVTPVTQSVRADTIPAVLSAGLAKGGACDGSYSYQWLSSTDSIHFSKISGANGKDYQPGLLGATTWFRRSDSCAVSGLVLSNISAVRVMPVPVTTAPAKASRDSAATIKAGMLIPQTQTLAADSLSALLVCVGFDGADENASYKWYSSPDGSSWALIPGVTSPGYNPGIVTETTYYRVIVSDNGKTATSATAVIYQNSKP